MTARCTTEVTEIFVTPLLRVLAPSPFRLWSVDDSASVVRNVNNYMLLVIT
jgi:hypothetical protein